ncbi:MAG TPA: alcohol dehydrogenase catalytic domain-containing protein [Symbiobacteriaceae bacterium]|nr:alcohol dehydrogenase catalytic domain-containing protein [Symbiobacteriaceae bacterium]
MKAAVFVEPGRLELRTVPDPRAGAGEIVLRVDACGICGSDLHTWRTGEYVSPGQIMGHEFVGRVVEVGTGVEGVRTGDRVTGFSADYCGECYWCRSKQRQYCPQLFRTGTGYGRQGAFAEYVKLDKVRPGRNCFLVPDSLSDRAGALVEPVGVAALAVQMAELAPGQRAVVLGAGLIGNAVAQILRRAGGAHEVVVSEPSELRRQAALARGVDMAVDPLAENLLARVQERWGVGPFHFGSGGMADFVVDCAGAPGTFGSALDLVRSAGAVALVALPDRPVSVDLSRIVHKGPRVFGVLGSHMARAIELLAAGVVHGDELVTHEFPLDAVNEAFATQRNAAASVKVMIRP